VDEKLHALEIIANGKRPSPLELETARDDRRISLPDYRFLVNFLQIEGKEIREKIMRGVLGVQHSLSQGLQPDVELFLALTALGLKDFSPYSLNLSGLVLDGNVDLTDGLFKQLLMERTIIRGKLKMENTCIEGDVQQQGLMVEGDLMQDWMQIEGNLLQSGMEVKGNLNQYRTKIHGDVDQSNAAINGNVKQEWMRVGDQDDHDKRIGGNVDQSGMKIKGSLSQWQSYIPGTFKMKGMEIGGDLDQSSVEFLGEVDPLREVSVKGEINRLFAEIPSAAEIKAGKGFFKKLGRLFGG